MYPQSRKALLFQGAKSHELAWKSQNDQYPLLQKNIFNSKLFIDLEYSNFSKYPDRNISSDCETTIDIEDEDINNKGCFLNKELINELDFPDSSENNLNDVNNKLLLSLVNQGYEYIPKKYQFQQKNEKVKIPFQKKKKQNNIKERKGDWVCQFCSNINFAFRTICNRCKGKKEICLQKIIM